MKHYEMIDKMFEKLLGSEDPGAKEFVEFVISGLGGAILGVYALFTQNWILAAIVSPFVFFVVSFFILLPCAIVETKRNSL